MTELSIHKLYRFSNRFDFISSIHMLFNDEIDQTTAKFDNVVDNIFKAVCCMNVHNGNKFLLATYEPTQLQFIRGHLFLVAPLCYAILGVTAISIYDGKIVPVNFHLLIPMYKSLVQNVKTEAFRQSPKYQRYSQ